MRPNTVSKVWNGKLAMQLVLALTAYSLMSAHAASMGEDSTGSVPSRHAPRHHNGANLEDRVNALTRALDLDAKQQSELRRVLLGQREQIRRVWDDVSVPAAYRVIATQSISDRTADQIRSLLNEEQKKKYKPPRPEHGAATDAAQPNVENWMKAAESK
jgi:hypothetical protein